ncbi:MAG: excinuclease ABC subunit UvrC [Malacoplasma sp.]
MNISPYFQQKISIIPKSPGCYLWKDRNDVVIYIGKAKNLSNRIKNYFVSGVNTKVKRLIAEAVDIDYIVVGSETEALILESNLIKKYKPKYNVLLKENVAFPYIVITNELHPRILYTHTKNNKMNGIVYGPFPLNNSNKYELFNFLNKIFPLRKCPSIPNKKCLYYDLKQCLGPCINKDITAEDYKPYLKSINNFFNGKIKDMDETLYLLEKKLSDNLEYEEANKYFELRKNLLSFSTKQEIIFSSKNNEDVIGFSCKENILFLMFFKYSDGVLLNKYELVHTFFSTLEDELLTQIFTYYSDTDLIKPNKVYVALEPNSLNILTEALNIDFINPQGGVKKRSLEIAVTNSFELMKKKYLLTLSNNANSINGIIELEKILNINNLYQIEIFDNSSIFATDRVSAMVVYINGSKNKNLYRKFIIKNDYKSDYDYMREVIFRRYKKLVTGEKGSLPNLIIVDGGKIQVNAAIDSLKLLNLDSIIPVIGLAKNSYHKTEKIVTSNDAEITLDKRSPLYFYLLEMQDEVHRFAINFHRSRKTKSLFSNSLQEIEGLGKKRIEKLIARFETIDKIKETSIEELSQIIPRNIAIRVKNKLNN